MTMKRHIVPVLIIIMLAALGFSESDYKFEEKEQIQKTLKFQDPAKPKSLQLDNVFGAIDVQGYDGSQVELVAQKTIKAKTQDKIQKAKEEVKLDIKEEGGAIDIYVDGPFRCQCENGKGLKWRDSGYEVHYDFVLKVPRKTSLTLKTVNHGDIAVKGVEGVFDVNNVNGKIEMEGVAGSGESDTVNGRVKIGFSRNPDADCSFRTVNGDVELSFREGLSADVKMKTFNGEAFSDFEVKALPAAAEVKESQKTNKTKFVYKRDRFTQVRIGKGGPAIECDTLNGDILIKKSH
jgi:DUF4097 and DUF4098 domain-containing protein YvlB